MQTYVLEQENIDCLHRYFTFSQEIYLKNNEFFALFLRIFAMGFEICLIASTPNFATGNAPMAIFMIDFKNFRHKSKVKVSRIGNKIKSICNYFKPAKAVTRC